ncbi:MAG: 23S rRNA (uracil(1939)-C(5))-methyltransferase RlmD [Bacteroidales bacterium]|nr:23S rRNA (uracil(1939)-C(5))-methyltransferase RlmD [Bacteroidales bacterium]
MARKKKELPLIEGVEIKGVAAEGKAIARVNDLVVFIPYAAPGDIADIQLTRKKNSYAEGKVITVKEYSPFRVEPKCSHFGVCGGCKWQHLDYSKQIEYKQQQVIDNLTRIGKVQLPEVSPILGSEKQYYYRNKLEFTFSNRSWLTKEELDSKEEFSSRDALGFHIPGMFDKVLDIKECHLQDDISNKIRLSIREFAIENGYSFYDLRAQVGDMRGIIVRTSSTGEIMLIVIFATDDKDKIVNMMQHISSSFPQITSLMYVINQKCNDIISDLPILTWSGKDHIIEQMEDLKFKVGPKSFYQTNSEQAYRLYSVVRDFANLSGDEFVYDLYTGTGTIANFVAKKAKKVIGIEYVPDAIEDAKVNSKLNNIENTYFIAGDMKDILTNDFVEKNGRPDVIITDPPRAGMHEDVVNVILAAAPEKIVYVSCNPATQARDAAMLESAYKITKVQPVDMFPHTHHVENVMLFEKR